MKPRTPSDLAADMAWQVVTPRERLPGPGKRDDGAPLDYEDDEPPPPFAHWPEHWINQQDDDPTGLRFFRGALNVLCVAIIIAAFVAIYVATP